MLIFAQLIKHISFILKRKLRIFPEVDFTLTLDRLMSGKFLTLFLWVFLATVVVFGLLWLIFMAVLGWNPGEAFLQLSNPSPHQQEEATIMQWIAIIVMNLFGLFVVNGVVLTLWVNWVSNRKDRHNKGEARYNGIFNKRFSVIIGGHPLIAGLAHELISNGNNEYVLIQTLRNPEILRGELRGKIIDKEANNRIIIYSGNRVAGHELEDLHLDLAQAVYIIGESNRIDGDSHDTINMQTWKLINELYHDDRDVRIPCHVMFEYQSTFRALQFTDLHPEGSKTFRFIPFSIYENWAQQVLIPSRQMEQSYYLPLEGNGGLPYDSDKRVHLIIVGMSKMGVELAIEAAHIAHYPNFLNPNVGHPRTLITFIDRNARREMSFLKGQFRELFQIARWRYVKAPEEISQPDNDSWNIYDSGQAMSLRSIRDPYHWNDPLHDEDLRSPYCGRLLGDDLVDIDFEFIEGDVALPSVQKYMTDACEDHAHSITTIAICLSAASEAMSAALYFEPSVYEHAQQIWVYQTESGALVDALRHGLTGQDNNKFSNLRPFGMLSQCDYFTRIHGLLPKIVAYAYACLSRNTTLADEYQKLAMNELIDAVETNWLSISDSGGKSAVAKRWSNIYCANSFGSKIRSIGIDECGDGPLMNNEVTNILAMVEHNRWVMEQLLLGFRPLPKDYKGEIPVEDNDEKERLKALNIHCDLISNAKLGSIKMYDEGIVKIIPLAIAISQEYAQQPMSGRNCDTR